MRTPDDISIEIDLQLARQNAVAAKSLLNELRSTHDLSRYEYTLRIRIAPFEVPHSHPILTLNGRIAVGDNRDDDAFLSVYLHEQIHWALDIHREIETKLAIDQLGRAYPSFHVGLPETAASEHSTYLHFIVNWLEISATEEFIGRDRAEAAGLRSPVYRSIYRTVINDYNSIEKILTSSGVLPLPAAGESRGSS